MLYFEKIFVIMFINVNINLVCEDGIFGYNCVNLCSGYCFNSFFCNKQNGYCDRGCELGYIIERCSKGM